MIATYDDFFRAHYDDIVAGVQATGATFDVAADASQEAFIRAYPRWWRIRRYRNPAAWVQRVAINVRRDIERSERRRGPLVATIEVEQQVDNADHTFVGEAVATLPPQQQRAVEAFYTDGLSTGETADIMGISPGAVRFHLTQARHNLRPMLANEMHGIHAEEN